MPEPIFHDMEPHFLGFGPGNCQGVPWWDTNKSGTLAGLGPIRAREDSAFGETVEEALENLAIKREAA